MSLLVKILGILVIAMAVLIIIRPQALKKLIGFFQEGKAIYLGAVSRLIIGVFLLLAASGCRYPSIVIALGIITLAMGILTFIIGIERCRAWLKAIGEKSELIHRLIAIIPLAFGILLVYAG